VKQSAIRIALVCGCIILSNVVSSAGEREFRLGVLYSLSGAYAPPGGLAVAGYQGTMVAVDMINARGGIGGQYKVVPVVGDAGSDTKIAVREAQRLMKEEKVPVVVGLYSSKLAEPVAPVAEGNQKILWVTIALSDGVLVGLDRKYVFRVRPLASLWGIPSVNLLKTYWEKFGREKPEDIRIALIHEAGPFGLSISESCERRLKKYGFNLVLKQAYSTKPDSLTNEVESLVSRLKLAKPDAILMTGYFDDTVLFFREASKQGLKCQAIVAHSGGAANMNTLQRAVGSELVQDLFIVDTVSAQVLELNKLADSQREIIKEFLESYRKQFNDPDPPSHATAGFNYTWILLNNVLPAALKKFGNLEVESIRNAALELDLPPEATPCGFGVRFAGQRDKYSGQNLREQPSVMQWRDGKLAIAWPENLRTIVPVIPFRAGHPLLDK
jgi:branched-chain amino acid transport system substrate-binding protein